MLYSCKPLFDKIKAQVAAEIAAFDPIEPPTVCIITTGDDEPSRRYVRNKLRDFEELGIVARVENFKARTDLLNYLLDSKNDFDGVIVQRPVALEGNTAKEAAEAVADFIRPGVDIDGVTDHSSFTPPSVRGLDLLLREWNYDPAGKTAVVIGRGDVGKPVAEYLLSRDATVTICHSKTYTDDLHRAMRDAHIVIGAAGLSEPIQPFVRCADSVVIDYGITNGADGKLHGDFITDYADYYRYHTAVPGGMGLMVRAGLLLNIIDAYKMQRGLK